MFTIALIDYGCHSFAYKLAAHLSNDGFSICYFANGSLESPNLSSLPSWMRQTPSLVRNIRCQKPYGKMSLHRRLMGEIEWAGHCIRKLEEEPPAIVIGSCIPLAGVTRIQAWTSRRRIPFVYWLQDLQGRAIHDLLGKKMGFPGRVVGCLASVWEQTLFERSSHIITIAPGHDRELPLSVRNENRYTLLRNWADIEEFPLLPTENEWAKDHGLDRTLNILYSGTLGMKHDLNMFCSLAESLAHRRDARVVIVSSGQAAESVRREAVLRTLDNLIVLPFQPSSDVPKVLASASVLIAPLERSAGSFCVPSKILSYLCAGRPTVIAIDRENPAAKTILESQAGVVVEPGNLRQFTEAVAFLLDNAAERVRMGAAARRYAETTFGLNSVASKFLQILNAAGAPLPVATINTGSAAVVKQTTAVGGDSSS